MFTGMHHSREPLSLAMNVYIFSKIIYDYNHGSVETKDLLANSILWFIPIINIDGYRLIEDHYFSSGNHELIYIRKNRRKHKECS